MSNTVIKEEVVNNSNQPQKSKKERKHIRQSLTALCIKNNYTIESLIYVHHSDEELLKLNQSALKHDTYTDIITFDLSDTEGVIDGEIYISCNEVVQS